MRNDGEDERGVEEGEVGDVCELKYGKGLPQRKRIGGEFPVYGSGGVVGYHTDNYNKVTKTRYSPINVARVWKGDQI